MSRKHSTSQFKVLPDVEIEICRRVGAVRKLHRLLQPELAQSIGITKSQLANIESARVPLRFWTGWRICTQLNINQLWLATGQGTERPFININLSKYHLELSESTLFSVGCSSNINSEISFLTKLKETRHGWDNHPIWLDANEKNRKTYQDAVALLIEDALEDLPTEHLRKIVRHLHIVLENILAMESNYLVERSEGINLKTGLTDDSEYCNTDSVKSELDRLLETVRKLTQAKGKKAELAKFLHVEKARVSEWLAGKYKPGGDITLRLVNWVQNQRGQ